MWEKGFPVEVEELNGPLGNVIRVAWLPPECTRGRWIELIDASEVILPRKP